jgi:prepilin-type N-terminal cleavage/methylation domain-containing protein
MGGVVMNRGFTLIEVLVALLLCMVIFSSSARLSQVSIRTGSHAEAFTCASVFGHTKIASLANLPPESADLVTGWHQDPVNPIMKKGIRYFRFWRVDDVETGKKVVLYIAWDDSIRGRAADYGSEGELKGSRCSKMSFSDLVARD